ncbi:hypothetical protein C7T35_21510 [Variovorax sp. WS11]|uniref:hypothetical protein n=1 Tax=Variovorax sp. WS11 TaxID=1105204 RepID=UPI000D0CE380|nr:hypothetical protein [Variovorax sp. WS11]NDZ18809.1 hypothetical protein [Variovorax sp. WS11]PSL82584.1 hypothetical protein C7T35_21510 [Variovorax sp. WS11]
MNTFIPGYLSALALSSLAGCSATNPSLMFGDTTTSACGYRVGSEHNVIREQTLSYDRSQLGRTKSNDPPLRGRADFLRKSI